MQNPQASVGVVGFLKNNPKLAFLYLYATAMPLVGSGVLSGLLYQFPQFFGTNAMDMLFFALATALLMGFACCPTTFAALIAGYLFGLWGIIPVVVSYSLASLIGYSLVNLIEKGKAQDFFMKNTKTQFIMQNITQHEALLIILCRLSPILPFAIMNIFLSTLKVRIKNFLLHGSMGMLPRSAVFVVAGSRVKDVMQLIEEGKSFPFAQISFVLLLIVSSIGLVFFIKKYILNTVKNGNTLL